MKSRSPYSPASAKRRARLGSTLDESSSRIVASPAASEESAPMAEAAAASGVTTSWKVSAASATPSPVTGTSMKATVCPARKVSVPEVAV